MEKRARVDREEMIDEKKLKLRKQLMKTALEVLPDMSLEGIQLFINFLQEWIKFCKETKKEDEC